MSASIPTGDNGPLGYGHSWLARLHENPEPRPHMRQLMEDSGETVNLAFQDEGEAVYLSQVECRKMMCVCPSRFARAAALLQDWKGDDSVGDVGQDAIKDPASPQHAAPDRQDDHLVSERVRVAGYAVDDEEHSVGLRCIAAPIFDET